MVPKPKRPMTKASADRRKKLFLKRLKDPNFVIKDMHYYTIKYKKPSGSDDSENPLPRY